MNTPTVNDFTQLVIAIAGLVTALGIAWPIIRGAQAIKRMEVGVNTLHSNVADIVSKTDSIVHATNSAATASTALTASLQKQNDMLRDSLAEKKETAALLTQALATAKTTTPIAVSTSTPTPPTPSTDPTPKS